MQRYIVRIHRKSRHISPGHGRLVKKTEYRWSMKAANGKTHRRDMLKNLCDVTGLLIDDGAVNLRKHFSQSFDAMVGYRFGSITHAA